MTDYWYTLRDDAPTWARDAWPGEEGEPMSAYDVPTHDEGHTWELYTSRLAGTPIRHCTRCGTREAYWDDDMYGPDFCTRDLRPYVDAWEVVASLDHGLRAADETMVTEVAILASTIMRPVLAYMVGADTFDTNPYTAACDEVGYDGDGWADDVEGSERISWLHDDVVFYRNYDQCSDVIVETSADAGMTWFLVRADVS